MSERERPREGDPVRVAVLGPGSETARDRDLERVRDSLARRAQARRRAARGARERLGRRVAPEGRVSGEALVDDHREREDVARGPDRRRLDDLLRGHVAGRPSRGGVRDRQALARARSGAVVVLGEAEVGDEGPPPVARRGAVAREEDVLGFHVAVDDPEGVGAPERRRQRLAERDRVLDAEPPDAEPLAERAPRDERHDDEGGAVRLARVEERNEARGLAERREEPALALEPRARLRRRADEDLHGDGGAAGAAGTVDRARAALADLFEDVVSPEPHPRSLPGFR